MDTIFFSSISAPCTFFDLIFFLGDLMHYFRYESYDKIKRISLPYIGIKFFYIGLE